MLCFLKTLVVKAGRRKTKLCSDQSDNDRGERQRVIRGVGSAWQLVIGMSLFSLGAWSASGSYTFLRRDSPLPYRLQSASASFDG